MAKVTAPKGSVNKMMNLISICYSNSNCLRSLNYNFFWCFENDSYVVKKFLIFFLIQCTGNLFVYTAEDIECSDDEDDSVCYPSNNLKTWMQPQKEVSIILIVRVFDNFLVILVIEKRSECITKSKWLEYPERTR